MFAPLAGVDKSLPVWIEGEYLLWAIKKNPLPVPLVTQGSLSDPIDGALGQPGTKIKLGRQRIDMGWMSGFQVTAGSWLNTSQQIGIETSYFLLPRTTQEKSLRTSGELGSPSYAVPIFDVTGLWGLNGVPGESVYLLPGPFEDTPGFFGDFNLKISSQLQGAQLNGIYTIVKRPSFQLNTITGFRWLQLKEQLKFQASTHAAADAPFGFSFANTKDRFKTENNFYGGQLGISTGYATRYLDLKGALQVGLGAVCEAIHIQGSSRTSDGNLFYKTKNTANETLTGGIFAQKTNIGTHHRQAFAAVVDASIQANLKVSRHLEFGAGYSFLWISALARPGKQIDRKINPTLTALAEASRETVGTQQAPTPFGMPGPAQPPQGPKRPKFSVKNSDFWAQGLTVGVTARF
ncbi:MAG: BBP7 family outer membrane beta-barrel protein [Chlamydiales bacterium]|nr:BBP7 family outer membrane beta-barrel protein [Chlamydiales bacterium]